MVVSPQDLTLTHSIRIMVLQKTLSDTLETSGILTPMHWVMLGSPLKIVLFPLTENQVSLGKIPFRGPRCTEN